MRTFHTTTFIVSLFLSACLFPGHGLAATVPTELDAALVPPALDSDDVVEFAVAGRFSSTCFRVAGNQHKVNPAERVITVRQLAVETKELCLRVLQPFAQIVTLGVVPAGSYRVVDEVGGTELGRLDVERADPATEPRYALVRDVSVDTAARTVRLRGELGDRCSRSVDFRVRYDHGTILIEPVVSDAKATAPEGARCRAPGFDETIQLRSDLEGTHLLQVRSRGGKPLSRIVHFE